MKNTFYRLLVIIPFLLAVAKPAKASIAESSAELKIELNETKDSRYLILTLFLQKINSPLKDEAEKIITEADKNNLDWRLLPAITGVESSFGKRIPLNSYNAYGWANGQYHFKSWESSIEIVSRALKTNYADKGAKSVKKIARVYNPPSSSSWASKVNYFINQIDPTGLSFAIQ